MSWGRGDGQKIHSIHIPPFNPGIFGGGYNKKFLRNISPDHMKYTPRHMFFGRPKEVEGGSSGCHILAQRWYGTPFHFRRTYIHTYIHIYIYIHACIQPGSGETIINHILFAEIFLGFGGGTHTPFLKYFSFYPPTTPRGDASRIYFPRTCA